jgi:hypothetical protein
MADDEISRYYRSLFYREFPYLGKLTRPVWGTHISVIRGEKIINSHLWKSDENKLIEFEYSGGVKDNGEYYWLSVSCPYLLDLREKLGLVREPRFGLHLTIGRTTKDV